MKSKRIISCLLAAVLLMAALPFFPVKAANHSPQPTGEDTLVLYASFDEGTISDNILQDLSGKGNHGKIVGSLQWEKGILGNAAYFNNDISVAGKDAVTGTNYINFGRPQDLIFDTGSFTVSAFIKLDSGASTNTAILSNKNYANGSNVGFALGHLSGAKSIVSNINTKGGKRVDLENGSMQTARDGNWHMVTAVYQRGGSSKIYLDGVLKQENSQFSSHSATADAGLDLVLGAAGSKTNAARGLYVDELRIYKSPLQEQQVKELYEETIEKLPAEPVDLTNGLVLHADFETLEDGVVPDNSGNNNHGSITGDVAFEPSSGVGGVGKAAFITNENRDTASQYIDFGRSETIALGTGDFSLSLWVKFKDGAYRHNTSIFSQRNYDSGSSVGFTLGNQADNPGVGLIANIGNGTQRRERQGIFAADTSWHHVVVSVKRNGDIITYLDGAPTVEKWQPSSAPMDTFTSSLDTGLPWVLGADGTYRWASTNLFADNVRLYNKALSGQAAKLLYVYEGAGEIIGNMLKTAQDMPASEAYPQEAIDAICAALTGYLQEIHQLTPEESASLVEKAQQEFSNFLSGAPANLSFALVSDIHIRTTSDANANAFVAGLKDMKSLNLDAFVNGGDNTDFGFESEIKAFYQLYTENQPVPASQAIHALGNHDLRGTSANNFWTNKPEEHKNPPLGTKPLYYPAAVSLYKTYNQPYMPPEEQRQNLSFDQWINGYHFIVLNSEMGLKDTCWFSDETLQWLEQKLQEGAQENKPIFVINHQQLNDTHWRSNILSGFGQRDAQMKELFEKYPQVIFLSGHIHNGFGVAEAVVRPFGTMVEIPSFNQSENGLTNKGIGYVVQVYDSFVRFSARDFTGGKWLPEHDITFEYPALPQVYSNAAYLYEKDFTPASWQPFSNARQQTEALLNTLYDQSVIGGWDDVAPPAKSLYGKEMWSQIEQTKIQLSEGIQGLVGVDETKSLPAVKDIYLQAGADADKPSTGSSGAVYNKDLIKVKNSDGQQNYTRKALVSFDLTQGSSALNSASLVLEIAEVDKNPGPHFTGLEVYVIPDGWQADTATWNSTLYDAEKEKAGQASLGDMQGNLLTIDVSEAVAKAFQQQKTSIAFELSIPQQANDNKIEFYSSRKEGANGPVLLMFHQPEDPASRPEDEDFKKVRLAWTDYLLGGDFDPADPGMQGYVNRLNNAANSFWNSMIKSDNIGRSRLWENLDLTPIPGTGQAAKDRSGNITTTYKQLRDLALAYTTKGTDLFGNTTVRDEVIKGLDFMHTRSYNTTNPVFGNWWHWDIGTPIASLSATLVLYDELTDTQLKNYTDAVNRYCPSIDKTVSGAPVMTGANLMDKGTAVALNAVLRQDSRSMADAVARFKDVFVYVTTGDGFYQDGSYIQHQALSFIGAYGKDLYNKLSILFTAFSGSPWEIRYIDGSEKIPFDFLFTGVEPFFFEGHYMDMVSGRDIVRNWRHDKIRGADILTAILPMGQQMPTQEMQNRFNSMAKAMLLQDPDYFFANCDNITAAAIASRLLRDDSIIPRSSYELAKVFTMDKAVFHTPTYSFGISMSSTRTYGHELINEEGKRTWNIGDGMTYLYLPQDKNQYSNGYWATVDPTRLAGTTAEHTIHPNGAMDRRFNNFDWVGGSTLDEFGAVGMHTQALGTGGTRNGATAQKSWFMLGDEIVALGAGISSSTGNVVETIIDNRQLFTDDVAGYSILVNGQPQNLYTATNRSTPLEEVTSIHLEGSGSGIGYVFPDAVTVNGLTEIRTGDWNTQGNNSGIEKGAFATLWLDHGAKPEQAQYQYILLPGASAEETQGYAAENDIEILENSTRVQAVHKASAGVTAANFWQGGSFTVGGLLASNPASITMVRNPETSTITLAVSDPTQKDSSITVRVSCAALDLLSKSDNITVQSTSPYIEFTVDTTGLYGQSSIISFQYDPDAQLEILSFEEPSLIKTPLFTPFSELALPQTITVAANDGKSYELGVEWMPGDYNRTCYGVYSLEGEIILPEGFANSLAIQAVQRVQVGEISTNTQTDFYVRGGSYNNDGAQLDGVLYMKNEANPSYCRKILLQFDIQNIPKNLDRAYITAQLSSAPSADFERAELYLLENDWQQDTITYNSFPARVEEIPIAGFSTSDIGQDMMIKMDVSLAVQQALEAGESFITLELSIPTSNGQNSTTLYSSRTTVPGAQKPALVWEKDPPEVVPGETNAEFLIRIAKNLDPAEYQNFNQQEISKAVAELETCLQNPNTSPQQLEEKESALNLLLMSLRKVPQPKIPR